MTDVLLTGANGQLGREFQALAPAYDDFSFCYTDIRELDISNVDEVDAFLSDRKFDVLINCAAYTNVDKAEVEPEMAKRYNTDAPGLLARKCTEKNILLVHISTDYVFNGLKSIPYDEDDFTAPDGIYAISKCRGEEEVFHHSKRSVIIRTSWLYSTFGNNFVKTMLKLGKTKNEVRVVDDQTGSPTYARDLAGAILDMLPKFKDLEANEMLHYANEGQISWFNFAAEIMRMARLNCKVIPIGTKEYPTQAPRPRYSVLNTSKIKQKYQIVIPDWRSSLKDCLDLLDRELNV